MDIHKPKPWRGWPEFLKEIGTIVIGVLIALGAEQAAEWLHARHLAEQTEADLAASLQPNLINAAEMWAFEPCGLARIKELADALQQPGSAWRANPAAMPPGYHTDRVMPVVYSSPGRVWAPSAWESAVASGALPHLPRGRVAKYAETYHVIDLARTSQVAISDLYPRLAALGYERKLTDQDKAQYLNLLSAIQRSQLTLTNLSQQLIEDAQALGVEPEPKALKQRMDEERVYRKTCLRDPAPLFPKS